MISVGAYMEEIGKSSTKVSSLTCDLTNKFKILPSRSDTYD